MPPKKKAGGQAAEAREPSESPPAPPSSTQGLQYAGVPLIVALLAAYFGGFLTLGSKRPVPAAHHRAKPPSQPAQDKQVRGKALLAAALNKTSPWLADPEFDAQSLSDSPTCGFRVLEASDLLPEMFAEGGELERVPLLVRGLTSKWPAHEKWERTQLIDLFGNKTVLAGSESSIVYGGGTATMPMKLATFLASMRRPSAVMPDAFTFDVSVLDSIPELAKDYRVPLMFKSWGELAA